MTPAIRLGGEQRVAEQSAPPAPLARVKRRSLEFDSISTRMLSTSGRGRPALLLHGWMDNAETWLDVLGRLAEVERPAVAYDQPGFGDAPPLEDGNVLDQLVGFAATVVEWLAAESGEKVIVAGNSLGGWVALRLAARGDLPLAGVVPVSPAGIQMAPLFFTMDRIPAVRRIIGLPAPVPPAAIRTVVSRLYRSVAFGDPAAVPEPVVERFTRGVGINRPLIAQRLAYAKRLRGDLADPFDAERIRVPVHVIWGDRDRLTLPAGAEKLEDMLPGARIEMLAGVGHSPQAEAPEAVVAAIEELAAY
jgi:pimeloyl-ACP methyl ester carboxylesterase